MSEALANRLLWDLSQQRHVILHRKGLIDARYIDATGETAEVGSTLMISPDHLEENISAVAHAGTVLLSAAGKIVKAS